MGTATVPRLQLKLLVLAVACVHVCNTHLVWALKQAVIFQHAVG